MLTKEKEEREAVEKELERVGRELQETMRKETEGKAIYAVPVVARAEDIDTSVSAMAAGPLYSTVVQRHPPTPTAANTLCPFQREGGRECWW